MRAALFTLLLSGGALGAAAQCGTTITKSGTGLTRTYTAVNTANPTGNWTYSWYVGTSPVPTTSSTTKTYSYGGYYNIILSANRTTPTVCNGQCVENQTDNFNCGTCGNACPNGSVCVGGACACPAGLSQCNGTCVDPGTDPGACGYCGHACAGGQVCSNGQCVTACDVGLTACGASCQRLSIL